MMQLELPSKKKAPVLNEHWGFFDKSGISWLRSSQPCSRRKRACSFKLPYDL